MRNTVIGLISIFTLALFLGCTHREPEEPPARDPRIPITAKYNSKEGEYFLEEKSNGINRSRYWNTEGNLTYEIISFRNKGIVIRRTIENGTIIANTWRYINRTEVIEMTVTYDEDGSLLGRRINIDGEEVSDKVFGTPTDYTTPGKNPIEDRESRTENQTIHSMLLNGVLWVEISRDLNTGIITEIVYDREGNIINKLVKQGKVMIKEEIFPWKPSDVQ